MNACINPLGHSMLKKGSDKGIAIHIPGAKFRLCRWNADNPEWPLIIGEEKRWEIMQVRDHLDFVPVAKYPKIQFGLGTITEFQVFHDGKNKWIPCADPLNEPSKNFEASLLIIDQGLSQNNRGDYWDAYLNFFEPSFKMIVVGSESEALEYLREHGVIEQDVVVVRRLNDDGKICSFVETLRACGFTGQILGMADSVQNSNKLESAGCNKVFLDSQMSKLIRAVHNK